MGDGDECVHHIYATESPADVYDVRNIARQSIGSLNAVRDHSVRCDARRIAFDAVVPYGEQHGQVLHVEHFHKFADAGGHIPNVLRVPFLAPMSTWRGRRHLGWPFCSAAARSAAIGRHANAGCPRYRHRIDAAHGCHLLRSNTTANRSTMECSQGMLMQFVVFCVFFSPIASFQAFNWCKDPYFVKPETTPIYALVRHFGLAFGLILCAPHINR